MLTLSCNQLDVDIKRSAEALLASHLIPVASDLRMIEASILYKLFISQSFSEIDALVASATELHFRNGTIVLSWIVEPSLTWTDGGSISIGLEFNNMDVCLMFILNLEAFAASIDVKFIGAGSNEISPSIDHLAAALNDARLSPR